MLSTVQIDILKDMYNVKKSSMKEIADHLNSEFQTAYTRSAIAGHIKRLAERGLVTMRGDRPRKNPRQAELIRAGKDKAREKPVAASPREPQRRSLFTAPIEDITPLEVQAPAEDTTGCTIFQLNRNTCRWPLGQINSRPPYMYCGDKPYAGSPWCKHHYLRSVNPERRFRLA